MTRNKNSQFQTMFQCLLAELYNQINKLHNLCCYHLFSRKNIKKRQFPNSRFSSRLLQWPAISPPALFFWSKSMHKI